MQLDADWLHDMCSTQYKARKDLDGPLRALKVLFERIIFT